MKTNRWILAIRSLDDRDLEWPAQQDHCLLSVLRLACICFLPVVLPGLNPASAQSVFKCKDQDGTTIYQSVPCEEYESEELRMDPPPKTAQMPDERSVADAPLETGVQGDTQSVPDEGGADFDSRLIAEQERAADAEAKRFASCRESVAKSGYGLTLENFALRLCVAGLTRSEMEDCMLQAKRRTLTEPGWITHLENCIMKSDG